MCEKSLKYQKKKGYTFCFNSIPKLWKDLKLALQNTSIKMIIKLFEILVCVAK